jgi:electron transfer flavoprotein alpha subunit
MKIVCLVKQIPRPDSIEFDQETKSLKRVGVPLLLNPFDAGAVAQAAALRDATGGEVIALTMGPPQAEAALRTCLALGADRCIHLSDRAFALADTLGTSRTLSFAIEKEGGVDLVLCGQKTLDSETWQVPPETAAFLGWRHVTSVVELELADGRIRATRETEQGSYTYELDGPAVLSIARALDAVDEQEGDIAVWTASDLVDDLREHDKRFGQTGSPTRVLAVRDVTPERIHFRTAELTEAVARVQELLEERREQTTQWEKPEHLGEKPGRNFDAWTLIETVQGQPTRASLELLAKGRELAGKLGGDNVALVLGHGIDGVAASLGRHGAERVVAVDDERLVHHDADVWAAALVQVLRHYRPHVLTIPATANGRDLGPRVAGELELGMTGDCVNLGIDRGGRLIQTKPAYGGNIVSVIMGATTPQLATVRPRMFDVLEPRDALARVDSFSLDTLPEPATRLVDEEPSPAHDLDEADLVVLLGPEATAGFRQTGAAAVGGTRERTDLPSNRRIGLTGRAVAPNVLVAIGVPGDFEQTTGVVKATVIAAVNCGPEFEAVADVIFDGDAAKLVGTLEDAG